MQKSELDVFRFVAMIDAEQTLMPAHSPPCRCLLQAAYASRAIHWDLGLGVAKWKALMSFSSCRALAKALITRAGSAGLSNMPTTTFRVNRRCYGPMGKRFYKVALYIPIHRTVESFTHC